MIREFIKKLYYSLMWFPREIHYKKMRKRLTNKDFTVIASDCFSSFVYHNLGLRFNTPTINLSIPRDDFLKFVTNLKGFLDAEPVEYTDHTENYPVGSITYEGETVRLYFMHYKTFEEAKAKWNERKQRVNFSNIYIIQTIANNLTQEHADKFASLPYEHKLLVTHESNVKCDCMVTHKVFNKKHYKPGKILRFKSYLSCRRYMDDIDYVSFLNNE